MSTEIDFPLFFEYINDEDATRAAAAEKTWQRKVEAKQEQTLRKIMARLITKSGVGRFLSWL